MNEETYLMMIKQNTIMKRLIRILALIAVVFAVMPAHAVLKEKDLNNSLAVLRHELTTYHREQQDRLLGSQQRNKMVISSLKDIMMRSSQNSLMLYSQKTDYVFDLTYACNEATKQYQEFQKSISPCKDYVSRSNSDIARYDSLIDVLSRMPVSVLSDKARVDRNVCLTLAVNIRRMLIDNNEALKENMMWYYVQTAEYPYNSFEIRDIASDNSFSVYLLYYSAYTDVFKRNRYYFIIIFFFS